MDFLGRGFVFFAILTLPAGNAFATANETVSPDERTERCAKFLVAARAHLPVNANDPDLQRCMLGDRRICRVTKELLDADARTKGFIPQCGGQEVAGMFAKACAAGKILAVAASCAMNPGAAPSLEDVPTFSISSPSDVAGKSRRR